MISFKLRKTNLSLTATSVLAARAKSQLVLCFKHFAE